MSKPEPRRALEIRFLTKGDLPDLLELWQSAGLKIRPRGREHPDRLAAEVTDYPRNFLGAYQEGQLVAALIASWDGRRGWINRLAVHPRVRRKGLARRLIEAAEVELKSRGAQVVAALVEPENLPSLTLFATAGYRDTPKAVFLSKRDGPDV